MKKLQARGIRNIDVGCMQINLRYHPDAFENLESALDPETNARYAVTLLKRLHGAHKSWAKRSGATIPPQRNSTGPIMTRWSGNGTAPAAIPLSCIASA